MQLHNLKQPALELNAQRHLKVSVVFAVQVLYLNSLLLRAEISEKSTWSNYYYVQISYGVTYFISTVIWIWKNRY